MSDAAAPAPVSSRTAFYVRKLHSLSGIVPVGVFMCVHLFENASAAHGAKSFEETVNKINSMPGVLAMEVFGIWIPLLFHGLLGMVIVFEGKSNALAYPYPRNWLYVLQRVTGVLALAFIVFHFAQFRWRKEEFILSPYEDVHAALTKYPWVLWVYIVGIAACVFHFANGIAGFLFSWGFTIGPRAKQLAGLACAGLGAAIFALGMKALFSFV